MSGNVDEMVSLVEEWEKSTHLTHYLESSSWTLPTTFARRGDSYPRTFISLETGGTGSRRWKSEKYDEYTSNVSDRRYTQFLYRMHHEYRQ